MNPASFLAEHWWEIVFAVIAALLVAFFWEPIKRLFVSMFRFIARLSERKRFEDNYREWLINKYRFLNVRGIKTNAPVAIELERAFVSLKARKPAAEIIARRSLTAWLATGATVTAEWLRAPINKSSKLPELVEMGEKRHEVGKSYELRDLFRMLHKRFIVIGAPGSGKTTLLSYFALKFARGNAKELFPTEDDLLPVLINLRDTIKQGFLDVKTFGEKYGSYIECAHSAPTDFFKQRLDDGKCLVLLDGLDEVSKPEERVEVANWVDKLTAAYPRNVFIATSRPYGYETARLYNDFLELHILDFTPEQVEHFVRYWTKAVEIKARGDQSDLTLKEAKKKAEDLLNAIKESPKIEVLTVNPLLLTIVSLVHRYRATLPKRRVELYEECCDILLGYWDTAKGMASELQPRQKRTILQPLAYHLHRNGLREEKRDKIIELLKGELPRIGVSGDKAGELLEDVRHRCGMLVETKLGYFGFAHLTFQESLTARYVLDNDLEDFLVARRRDKYWLEVTLLYCGMKDTSTLLRKILDEKEDIFYSNIFAAGRCLAESLSVAPEIRNQINQSLLRVCWDDSEFRLLKRTSWEILREIKDPPTIRDLVERTRRKESYIRWRAAHALGEIEAKEAISPLIELLKDEKSGVRAIAAYALRQIQAKQVVPPLVELLKDEESGVRAIAASALRQTQAKEAAPPLIELLKDEKSYVRGSAADALGRIQAKEAVPPLIELLRDKERDVRGSAADALEMIHAKEAVPPLIELLKDKDSDVRGIAAPILGQIQAEEAVHLLVELLKDEESGVRAIAASALGQIQDREAVPPLIELLEDIASYVRGNAASALGRIQAREAVLPLIELLKDIASYVRVNAASALVRIQAREAVPPLIELLKDKDSDVRGIAASILGQIQAKEAVPLLVELLEDKEHSVRGFAAYALGLLEAKEALPPLVELLKDKESDVRGRAAYALGQIQAKEAVPPLIELLKHKESNVRGSAADALGRIQAKEAVPPLIELLKDKESHIRRSAADALGQIGDAMAVEPVKSLLNDKKVREFALEALRKISEKTSTPIYRD